MLASLETLYVRDLLRLKSEIESYVEENTIWEIRNEINNSAGNLCLHLIGNLNHYVGHQLGGTAYVRNRVAEFSEKNVSRSELVAKIEQTIEMIKSILPNISEELLAKNHTEEFQGGLNSNEFFLIHLLSHLNYHLGQINYHRRLIK
ncbi:hypothetical protein Emtol_4242 [Emticicia oligotrophica DSM 17448]|uniref:DinB superfamily protein n=1 Tax=Emticicia oligotrophica (strain DSM 17448 / CIP 109782 / MTCC 6937 / GPTSA100-15) TaxID=929562 RepID=A0ABM5N753_EMTOG|nr:DUF1572 family protein [Emticicia oligotrophica]AFK05366.1 hypothetical protein Emtol_4242 [Emticicia oligotrophica DSM 17448]